MAERLELRNLVVIESDASPSTSSPVTPPPPPSPQPQSQQQQQQQQQPKTRINALGLLLAMVSSLFFSLSSLIVKWLSDVDPLELAAIRFVGILLPAVPMVVYKNLHPYPEGHRLTLLARSVAGATSISLMFYAVQIMPLADASVIIFSSPVVVAVMARVFLKEPCGPFHYFALFLTTLGVVMITRPPALFGQSGASAAGRYSILGPLAALLSTVFTAIVYVLLRTLKHLHFSVILVSFAFYGVVQSSGLAWAAGNLCWPKCGSERWLAVALGVFSFAGQMLLTVATQLEEVGLVAIARTVDVVFAFLWQIMFFGEMPSVFSVVGAVLVTSSVVLIGLRKWILSMPSTSNIRKKFGFLLL